MQMRASHLGDPINGARQGEEVTAHHLPLVVNNVGLSSSALRRSPRMMWLSCSISSQDCVEVVCCAIYSMLCICSMSFTRVFENERPIPFQSLEGADEYVRNLVNNEVGNGPSVNNTYLLIVGIFVPFLFQIMCSCVCRKTDLHPIVCTTLVAQASNLLATDLLKEYAGYLRPIFYELCIPSEDYQQCTGTADDVSQARKSWPSGHASVSFCGMTLLALYLHQRFGIPSVRGHEEISGEATSLTEDRAPLHVRWRTVYVTKWPMLYRLRSLILVGICMGIATFISASRIVDNYHFPADVVTGALLGGSIALFIHGLWFDDSLC